MSGDKGLGKLNTNTLFYCLRYADDEDLNDELKDTERWNDPAAGFLTVSALDCHNKGSMLKILTIYITYSIEKD